MSDAVPVLLDQEPAPRATDVLRPRLTRYLWFGWTALVAALWTIPMSIGQVLAHRRRPTAATFHRWAQRWSRGIVGAGGVRVTLEDRARLAPGQPVVFVANHQTGLDILTLSAAIPYPFGYAAKAELREVPFLGRAIEHSACVFVDKRDPRRAVQTVQEAGVRIRGGNSVLIFAEGERSYSGGLLPFQRGAFVLAAEAGVPLVPVTILGNYRLLDERRLLMRPGRIRIVLHPPISMEGVTKRDLPSVIDRVRTTLATDLTTYEHALARS